jgi:DNA-binding transcriptional LysR family regulator
MIRREAGRAGTAGPVLAGILALPHAEDALRQAFDAAQHRAVPVRVVAAGLPAADEPVLAELVERWAGKYPAIDVTVAVSSVVEAAIVLTGAARSAGLAVLTQPGDAHTAAVVRAVTRRAFCPVLIAGPEH